MTSRCQSNAAPPLRHVGNAPIGLILAALNQSDDLFWRDKWRQSMPFSPHRDSDTLVLRDCLTHRPRDVLHSLDVVDRPEYAVEAFRLAVASVASLADGQPARALIARLRPNGKVAEHIDIGAYSDATDRYHLAIDDPPEAWIKVGGETVSMRPGQVWAIDKHVAHSAANDSATLPRTHLIVDVWRP